MCFLPLASVRNMGEVKPGDVLIVGQPWRAVECMEERTSTVSINIFCSDFVLKCPLVCSRDSTITVSTCSQLEPFPFMCISAFANRLMKSVVTKSKQLSSEQWHNEVFSMHGVDSMCNEKHSEFVHDATVKATASVADYESAIFTKDLKFAVPVAIVSFKGDLHSTVCYCCPRDFKILSRQLVEKRSYSLKQVVKETYSDPQGSCFRAFLQSSSVQPSVGSQNDTAVPSSICGASSRFSLQLEYHHQLSFKTRVDHVLVPENGHGFARFGHLNYPVYGCISGMDSEGSIIPIFVISREVADFIFARLSRIHVDFVACALQKRFIIFESLRMVSEHSCGNFQYSSSFAIADGFTKMDFSSNRNWAVDAMCPSIFLNLVKCRSQSVVIIDSFYNGGDQMCPKCHSSCSAFLGDFLCRHCGYHGCGSHVASGYLPLLLLVTDSNDSSTQLLQIRSDALSSFISQYISRSSLRGILDAEENLKDSRLFCHSLKGQKLQCCTLAQVCIDESIMMCEGHQTWMTDTCTSDNTREVLKVSID
jgi:hypothetical protein